ncbi:MAG: transglycosylase SLT domain-containing protein [Flavobacteriales bacterium]|nr:transglycosylase SLT domain-containing protein [Flavobacteriales bacterium]
MTHHFKTILSSLFILGSFCPSEAEVFSSEIPDSTLTIYDSVLVVPKHHAHKTKGKELAKDEDGDVLLVEDDSIMLKEVFSSSTFESIAQIDSLDRKTMQLKTDARLLPDSIFKKRMEYLDAHSPLLLDYNPEVRSYINMYLNRQSSLARMVGLSKYYYKMFEDILDRYDVPMELKHLVVIESALNPRARSRVGASGLWQFMYGTGRLYNLNSDSYVDDRYDPIKSTEAAARLLSQLYKIYGDWNMALAAYNYGSGNVNKAIARSGGKKNYWEVRAYMPRETRNYVSAFIAANYVMNFYRQHGIIPEMPIIAHQAVDTIQVKSMVSFDLLAKELDMPKEEIEFLNPQFKLNVVPFSDKKQYSICLPSEKALIFAGKEEDLYQIAKNDEQTLKKALSYKVSSGAVAGSGGSIIYKVKRGDTLGRIAVKYGVSVKKIQTWNKMKSTKLSIGQRLTIYPRK